MRIHNRHLGEKISKSEDSASFLYDKTENGVDNSATKTEKVAKESRENPDSNAFATKKLLPNRIKETNIKNKGFVSKIFSRIINIFVNIFSKKTEVHIENNSEKKDAFKTNEPLNFTSKSGELEKAYAKRRARIDSIEYELEQLKEEISATELLKNDWDLYTKSSAIMETIRTEVTKESILLNMVCENIRSMLKTYFPYKSNDLGFSILPEQFNKENFREQMESIGRYFKWALIPPLSSRLDHLTNDSSKRELYQREDTIAEVVLSIKNFKDVTEKNLINICKPWHEIRNDFLKLQKSYVQMSEEWMHLLNQLETIVAIPCSPKSKLEELTSKFQVNAQFQSEGLYAHEKLDRLKIEVNKLTNELNKIKAVND